MAEYLALIYGDEKVWDAWTPEEMKANDTAHEQFRARAGDAVTGGRALDSSTKARTIRVAGGEQLVSDGPYAETKDVVGGYYLLTAADLDEAVRLARLIPEASRPSSWVEVWPVMS